MNNKELISYVLLTTNVATYVALALPLPLIIKLVNFYYVQKNQKITEAINAINLYSN